MINLFLILQSSEDKVWHWLVVCNILLSDCVLCDFFSHSHNNFIVCNLQSDSCTERDQEKESQKWKEKITNQGAPKLAPEVKIWPFL